MLVIDINGNLVDSDSLYHHGILGMKWGKRNGPPYPLGSGDHSQSEKKAGWKKSLGGGRNEEDYSTGRRFKTSYGRKLDTMFNRDYKKKKDQVIDTSDTLTTLSYDPDRTKNTDMFFAAYKAVDKHQYNAMFNKLTKSATTDEYGNIVEAPVLKYRINNSVKNKIQVAGEETSADAFNYLLKKDKDFRNFVTDPDRMEAVFDKSRLKFKSYREGFKALETIRAKDANSITIADATIVYRLFNYVIPSDGNGDSKLAKDVLKQRKKLFSTLKEGGYGAILDTNDALYGGFKASAPVIVFDMANIAPKDVARSTIGEKRISDMAMVGIEILKKLEKVS